MLLCRAWSEYFTVSRRPYDDNFKEMNATANEPEKKSLSMFIWLSYFCFTAVILVFYMPVLVYLIAIATEHRGTVGRDSRPRAQVQLLCSHVFGQVYSLYIASVDSAI